MIDLHAHVLPSIDDGPQLLEDAVASLKRVAAGGVTTVVATPHVSERYPTTPALMEEALEEILRALRGDVRPTVLPGAEIASDRLPLLSREDLRRLGLGGSRTLLVELPLEGSSSEETAQLAELVAQGFRPLIAHPERYEDIQTRPGRAESLVAGGALLQVTASSLVGLHGRTAQATARLLLDAELVHVVASDGHADRIRRAPLADARRALKDDALFDWLTVAVPAAILADAEVPARPARRPRRRLRPW